MLWVEILRRSNLFKGAIEAINELSEIRVVLVGNKLEIEKELLKYTYDKDRIEILHTEEKNSYARRSAHQHWRFVRRKKLP